MKHLLILLSVLIMSCKSAPEQQPTDFTEQIVDLAISHTNNKLIELPYLYDTVSKEIIDNDADERLIMVQLLKKKGFEVINWGRGNHPLGPRLISIILQKDTCTCEVLKTYYATDNLPNEIYKTTESIRCYPTQL